MSHTNVNPAYARKGDLTTGPVTGHLVRLTVPMIWGIFAIISFQLVDTFFISLLGTQALAALTFTFPVTFAIFTMIMGLSIATSSVVSRQIGEGNEDKVKRLVTHGLIFALLTGLTLAAVGLGLMTPLFRAMGADDTMMPLIRDYMNIWFAGAVCLTLPLVGNAALRAGGNTTIPALIMIIAAVTNVILDPLLIFGLFGFPRLELQGAAIATVIANSGAMLAGLYVLHVKKRMICRDGLHLRHFGDSVKRLAFIAIPAGLTGAIQPIANGVIIALLAGYGAETVAAFGVATRLEAFAFVIVMALATGMAPIIGQNWGAKRYDRVEATLHKAFTFAVGWSLLVALVFMLFAKPLAGLFSPDNDPAFIHAATLYFWLVALTYAPGNLVQGWSSAFNAMGMPQRSAMMIGIKLLALQIPLALAGHHYFGLTGIFAAIAITNLVSGVGFHLLNRRLCRQQRQAAPQGAA